MFWKNIYTLQNSFTLLAGVDDKISFFIFLVSDLTKSASLLLEVLDILNTRLLLSFEMNLCASE